MALTKVTGQVINSTTDLSVGVATVGGGTSTGDLYVVGVSTLVGDLTLNGNVTIGGTLTYEDVTNVDSVGLITARSGISVTGVGVTIALGGLNVNAGISTFSDDVKVGSGITLSPDGDSYFTGISTFTDDIKVGSGITLSPDGDSYFTGIVTTTGNINAAQGHFTDHLYLADTICHTGDTNTKIRFPSNDHITMETGGVEYFRLDNVGNLLLGGLTIEDSSYEGVVPTLQIEGTNANQSALSVFRNSNDAYGSFITLGKSRGTSRNSDTIVQDDDTLGYITWQGADGGERYRAAAMIKGEIDGTPGDNDMPGRLTFSTTSDGAAAVTERIRVDCRGFVGINESAPDELLHLSANNNGVTAVTSANNTLRFTDIDTTVTSNQPGGVIEWETLDNSAAGVNAYISTKNSNTGYSSLHFGTGNVTTLEDRLVLGQGGDLTLYGGEGLSANLYLNADQGDDNGDSWRIGSNQDDNDLTIAHDKSGSHVDVLTFLHKVGNTTTNMFLWGQGVTDNNEAMVTVKGTTTGGTDRHSQLMVAKHSGLTNLASAMRWQSDDGTTRYLYMDNNVTVRLSGNYSDIGTTSGTVIGSQSSDIRLKNLIGDGSVPYGLSEINQLNPIRFKYKKIGGDPDRVVIGFSAQQVKPIIPEAVYDTGEEVEGEENILGMDYVNIIPALVNSIKELTAENNALKARLDAAGL